MVADDLDEILTDTLIEPIVFQSLSAPEDARPKMPKLDNGKQRASGRWPTPKPKGCKHPSSRTTWANGVRTCQMCDTVVARL